MENCVEATHDTAWIPRDSGPTCGLSEGSTWCLVDSPLITLPVFFFGENEIGGAHSFAQMHTLIQRPAVLRPPVTPERGSPQCIMEDEQT